MRERGLKHPMVAVRKDMHTIQVAPRAGAWIETLVNTSDDLIAPPCRSLPVRERGLKQQIPDRTWSLGIDDSRSPCGSVD